MEKIFIGNFPKGLSQERLPFFIDNKSFPYLYNFYVWRGRGKRKRGTTTLGRLQVQIKNFSSTLSATGTINIFIAIGAFNPGESVAKGTISFVVGANTYTEPAVPDGTLVGSPSGFGTINYATGNVTISGISVSTPITLTLSYYPNLPSLGLRDYMVPNDSGVYSTASSQYPLLLAFDTQKSYQYGSIGFYNTSFYKNPSTIPGIPSYVPKAIQTSFSWSGGNYQQFWTSNNQGALWATNNVPGMQIQAISSIARDSNIQLRLTIPSTPAIIGDWIWINEISGLTTAGTKSINQQTGFVTNVAGNVITVQFPYANITSDTYSGGIVQYLTNTVPGRGDGIKWYDGDPTNATGVASNSSLGWVNFAPPLGIGTVQIDNLFSTNNQPFYLVGALIVLNFKDRLLFFSPMITTSASAIAGKAAIQIQNGVIWSWNGTFYYTASYDGNLTLPSYNAMITPGTSSNTMQQPSDPRGYYVNETGFGGFLISSLDEPIISVNNNEDVLIVGFSGHQTKFIYTGNDLDPFAFYLTSSEFGTYSTFSTETLDRGVPSFSNKGIIMSDQTNSQRIELDIPDLAFQVSNMDNSFERINGARDFFREWIYFSYVPNNSNTIYPTQTFFWNYRDNTWAIFYENFTSHGNYRAQPTQTYTWLTIPWTWEQWNEPWNSNLISPLSTNVIAGNPQGYVLIKGIGGTGEGLSGYVSAIIGNNQFTSYNHCVNVGDYLSLKNFIGGSGYNGNVFLVTSVIDTDNFIIDGSVSGTGYMGGGEFARLSQPLLQTKQFPVFWEQGRQVRLGAQRYLFDVTSAGEVTINIYLSQNDSDILNSSPIYPLPNSPNDSLIYSQVVSTAVELDNLNMPDPPAGNAFQLWHRMNTSLIGDTFQLGITLSDAQMRNINIATSEIAFHAAILDIYPGPMLA